MNPLRKVAAAVFVLILAAFAEIPHLSEYLVSSAHAFRGRGAAFAVGAAAGSASASTQGNYPAPTQQPAPVQQQPAPVQQQAAPPQQQAAPVPQQTAGSGTPLPLGTVVPALPAGCSPAPAGGVQYYQCGGNFYQAVFEGSTLKYVTTKPQ